MIRTLLLACAIATITAGESVAARLDFEGLDGVYDLTATPAVRKLAAKAEALPLRLPTSWADSFNGKAGRWRATLVDGKPFTSRWLRFDVPADAPFAGRMDLILPKAEAEAGTQSTWSVSFAFARLGDIRTKNSFLEIELKNAAGRTFHKPALWLNAWLGDWRNQQSNRDIPADTLVNVRIDLDLPGKRYAIAFGGKIAEQGALDGADSFGGLTLAFLGEASPQPRAFGFDDLVISRNYTGPPVTIERMTSPDPVNLLLLREWTGKPLPIRLTLRNHQEHVVEATVNVQPVDESGPVGEAVARSAQVPAGGSAEIDVPVNLPGAGWWGMRATATAGGRKAERFSAVCLLHDQAAGVRPGSLFGLGFRSGTNDNDLRIAERLGVKWRRGADNDLSYPGKVAPKPGVWWDDEAQDKLRADVDRWTAAGVCTLGYINYNIPWNVPAGTQPHRSPPTDMAIHAEMVARLVGALDGKVSHWELWNEPGGFFWGGTADQYRTMLKTVWDRVKPEYPQTKLIAGGHYMWVSRNWVFPPGVDNAGWCDGVALHPYAKPGLWTPVSPALDAVLLAKAKGSGGGLWMTEVGTSPAWHFKGVAAELAVQHVARAIAPTYLLSKAGAGSTDLKVFWFMSGFGKAGPLHPKQDDPDCFNLWDRDMPMPGLAAYAAMAHSIEDGVLVEDVFAGSLRAWALLFRKPDGSHTVALWPETTWPAEEMAKADQHRSTWELPALDFAVIDWLGRPAGTVTDGKLRFATVTRGTHYLSSKRSVDEIRAALRAATVRDLPLLRVVPQPIAEPLAAGAALRLRVRNDAFRPRDISISLQADGLTLAEPQVRLVALPPGEDRYVTVTVTAATPAAGNRYRIAWKANADGETLAGEQEVQVACATRGTPRIDANLSDWADSAFVSIRHRGVLADWWDLKPSMLYDNGYRLATRWDDEAFYVAAEIPDRSSKLDDSGQDNSTLEYRNRGNDRLLLGFNVLDENPEDLLRNHPLHAKSLASDIDYEFSAELRAQKEGPAKAVLKRLLAPGTAYLTTTVPGMTPERGALDANAEGGRDGRLAVVYDASKRVYRYELALRWELIPELRDRLAKLKPGQTAPVAFDFMVVDGHKWDSPTRWCEENGDLEFGAYGFDGRVGTPCWLADYPTRLRAAWGFTR